MRSLAPWPLSGLHNNLGKLKGISMYRSFKGGLKTLDASLKVSGMELEEAVVLLNHR
jgi:hypothetical protein